MQLKSSPKSELLKGRTVVVTAGPTREHLDPVRFISNPSTGKMGYALAEVAKCMGANVILITGPTHLEPPSGVQVIRVVSALDLRNAVMSVFRDAHVVISAAAVADYRPQTTEQQKMKKSDEPVVVHLEMNPDILAELGRRKGDRILVGFAAETENLAENAKSKLRGKNLDMIIANDITREDSGFGSDTNTVTILTARDERIELPPLHKREVASKVLERVAGVFVEKERRHEETGQS